MTIIFAFREHVWKKATSSATYNYIILHISVNGNSYNVKKSIEDC